MADEPTPTPTSEPTPATPPSDPPAAEPQPAPADAPPADAPAEDNSTALGNDPPAKPEDGEPEAEASAVPEAYELAAPEGFEQLDAESVAAATPVFKELGLNNEQANKLVPVAADFAKRIVANRDQQLLGNIAEQRKEWLETAKKDAEIGGTNWDASLGSAAKALDQLGFPKGSELRNLLDESGLGNHPEMIRAFAKVGKAISEDTDFVRGGQDAPVKKTDAELFYGRKD